MNESSFRNADCTRCGLGDLVRKRSGHACIIAEPLGKCRLLVVGQNPGYQEDRAGRPFIGPSGELIRELLVHSPVSYAFTNAAKCWTEGNREPNLDELEACRPFLVQEILIAEPEVILALGNIAFKTLTGGGGVLSYRGQPQELRAEIKAQLLRNGYSGELPRVLPTVHPAYVLRIPKAKSLLEEDVTGAIRLCKQIAGEEIPVDATYMDGSVSDIEFNNVVSWDIESTSAQYRRDDFGLHIIGVDDGAGPVKILDRPQEWKKFHARLLKLEPEQKVTFNGLSFDEPAMRQLFGGNRSAVGDVMPLGYLLDESMPNHTLDAYAIRWLGVAPWKDRKPRTKANQAEIAEYWAKGPQNAEDWKELKIYNARDTKFTRDLWFKLRGMLSPELLKVYEYMLIPAIQALTAATESGLYLIPENIVPAREWTDDEMGKSLSVIQRIVADLWLGFDFNPNSTKQIARVLFAKPGPNVYSLGEKPVRYSEKTKLPSTDGETLKTIRSRSDNEETVEFCGNLLTYKEAHKMAGFLNRYEKLVESDGRLHPPYFTKTETGRTSSWIHTVPRKTAIRRIIGAPLGRKLIVADLSQIELRLVAWASRDPEMLATYKEGKNDGDLHNTTAKHIIRMGRGLPRDAYVEFDKELNKSERSLSKGVNFGCVYGAEAPTVRDYLWKVFGIRISMAEATVLRDDIFFGTYSGLIPWFQERIALLKKEKQVVSPIGRIRRLPNIDASDIEVRAEAARQGINTYIQSFGSDLALTSFFLVERDYPWLAPVMFHHDADLFECDEDRAEEGAKIVQHYMEVEALDYIKKHWGVEIDVPILSECKILQEWS